MKAIEREIKPAEKSLSKEIERELKSSISSLETPIYSHSQLQSFYKVTCRCFRVGLLWTLPPNNFKMMRTVFASSIRIFELYLTVNDCARNRWLKIMNLFYDRKDWLIDIDEPLVRDSESRIETTWITSIFAWGDTLRNGTPFLWTREMILLPLPIHRSTVHLFCNFRFPSTLASGAEKRIVDHAVTCAISPVNRLSSNTNLLVSDDIQQRRDWWAIKWA